MHLKSTKKLRFQATKIGKSMTSEQLTSYSGLILFNDYMNHLGLFKQLDHAFSTVKSNTTKTLSIQIFSAIIQRLGFIHKGYTGREACYWGKTYNWYRAK